MKRAFLALAASGILLLNGCASTAEIEREQLAWTGHGHNPCLFGGVTEDAELHCQQVRLGSAGVLMALNRGAIADLPSDDAERPCLIHVARVEAALADFPEYASERVYSCPADSASCHVSVLVTDPKGERYVMDNGAVLKEGRYSSGVAPFKDFVAALDQVYWLGELPNNARMIAAAHPRRHAAN